MIQKRFLNFHASFFNEKCPNTAKCPITPQFIPLTHTKIQENHIRYCPALQRLMNLTYTF